MGGFVKATNRLYLMKDWSGQNPHEAEQFRGTGWRFGV